MGNHFVKGPNGNAIAPIWPDRIPKDLSLRLADALRREHCGPDDLWDEIGDWLEFHNVTAPIFPIFNLASSESSPYGATKFKRKTHAGSATSLSRMIYTSRHKGCNAASLDQILQKSRANNVRDMITGVLVIGENSFLQLIEGGRAAINQCIIRIVQDKRHNDVKIISCSDVHGRLFQEWSINRIETLNIKKEILSNYLVNGVFDPSLVSALGIHDFFHTLSMGNWDARAV